MYILVLDLLFGTINIDFGNHCLSACTFMFCSEIHFYVPGNRIRIYTVYLWNINTRVESKGTVVGPCPTVGIVFVHCIFVRTCIEDLTFLPSSITLTSYQFNAADSNVLTHIDNKPVRIIAGLFPGSVPIGF